MELVGRVLNCSRTGCAPEPDLADTDMNWNLSLILVPEWEVSLVDPRMTTSYCICAKEKTRNFFQVGSHIIPSS